MKILSKDGGYVFAAVHNRQANVSVEKIYQFTKLQ